MLSFTELRAMSRARLEDAKVLSAAGRYDGAAYLVGYAVEYALKARVATSLLACGTFPRTKEEFERFAKLRIHNLPELLKLADREHKIRGKRKAAWDQFVNNWTPEMRYAIVGTTDQVAAAELIRNVEILLKAI